MPGFLGGGSSSGSSGELKFSKEFIDPVTKLRVSEPENLIDTDFEYGLQPTKWETVELINNTPSFFSKSGDTTIDGIVAITTNKDTREITVTTALDHGLAVGIPIQVTGTKSITADGSYIINSIPNSTTFTYLCKDNQPTTASIEDLYSSIITGEFFQGSQLRISDDAGITTDGAAPSILTVKTESTHGFGVNTPFYFLNLNSTISQQFQSSNTATKSFDASNSATAQTFDGSNTLSSVNIDLSNAPIIGGITSDITSTNPTADTINVKHNGENFSGKVLGTPLYYDVIAGSGFFAANPRGVVFLKSTGGLGTLVSTFQVSEIPDGPAIDITGSMTGTFQLANQARTFAGNNVNPLTQQTVTVINDSPKEFDATNTAGTSATLIGFSGSNITVESASALGWYQGAMVLYTTTGNPATGLANNTTYFVDFFAVQQGSDFSNFTLKPLPNGNVISNLSGGTGTQTFTQIFVSLDKDIIHIKDHGFQKDDMIRYQYPVGGRFSTDVPETSKNYYWVQTRYDAHNFDVIHTLGELLPLSQSFGPQYYDVPITTAISTVGMQSPITYSLTSGTLPSGMTLNTSTGVVSGTPGVVYDGTVRITGIDAIGNTAYQDITIKTTQPPYLYLFSEATFTPGGASGINGPNITQARNGIGNPAWAATHLQMPVYNGVMVWTVPKTGTYRIFAQGAGGNYEGQAVGMYGAAGAQMQGDFSLTQGQKLRIGVGQRGIAGRGSQYYYHGVSGGNGASFVAKETGSADADILIIAGGGGAPGMYGGCNWGQYPSNANTGPNGNTNTAGYYSGGSNGGAGSYDTSSGGAGWRANGGNNSGNYGPQALSAAAHGGYMDTRWGNYGHHGGFGGGGGAGLASGGSGGYSGGGGGQWCSYLAGGGGGSWNSGANQSNTVGGGNTDGYVRITAL